jgi:hypothetical protein
VFSLPVQVSLTILTGETKQHKAIMPSISLKKNLTHTHTHTHTHTRVHLTKVPNFHVGCYSYSTVTVTAIVLEGRIPFSLILLPPSITSLVDSLPACCHSYHLFSIKTWIWRAPCVLTAIPSSGDDETDQSPLCSDRDGEKHQEWGCQDLTT